MVDWLIKLWVYIAALLLGWALARVMMEHPPACSPCPACVCERVICEPPIVASCTERIVCPDVTCVCEYPEWEAEVQ